MPKAAVYGLPHSESDVYYGKSKVRYHYSSQVTNLAEDSK